MGSHVKVESLQLSTSSLQSTGKSKKISTFNSQYSVDRQSKVVKFQASENVKASTPHQIVEVS